MNQLSEASGFDDEVETVPSANPSFRNVYKLRRCGHKLHHSCLLMYLKQVCTANSDKLGPPPPQFWSVVVSANVVFM